MIGLSECYVIRVNLGEKRAGFIAASLARDNMDSSWKESKE